MASSIDNNSSQDNNAMDAKISRFGPIDPSIKSEDQHNAHAEVQQATPELTHPPRLLQDD